MYKIIYLPVARQDIENIILYISGQLKAPKAVFNLLDEFECSFFLLREFPYAYKLYRPVRTLEEEYRMLPVKNHAVFYVVREREKIVEIHRVIYARRNLTKLLK